MLFLIQCDKKNIPFAAERDIIGLSRYVKELVRKRIQVPRGIRQTPCR